MKKTITERHRTRKMENGRSFIQMHRNQCTVCSHPQLEEINRAFINGTSILDIVDAYRLSNRQVMDRHVQALGLRTKQETKALRSSLEYARHILKSRRFDPVDNPPSDHLISVALRIQMSAERESPEQPIIDSPEAKLYISKKLVPMAEEMARNILLRMGISEERVNSYLPAASVDATKTVLGVTDITPKKRSPGKCS